MICIVALVVFGILGIFSVSHRQIAKEAFDCVFRRITLRPCQTGFDQKMKIRLISKLMKFPKIAKFTHKHFEFISWIFTIALFSSMAYTGYSVYNLAVHGTCDVQNPQNCMFTPVDNTTPSENICVITGEFVMFYGESCPHCAKMKPIVEQVENETGVNFQRIEIWHNETNKQTFLMHAESIERDCGFLGVPSFYAFKTDRAICGEMSAEKLKQFIRDNG